MIVPLLMAADKAVKAKSLVDCILEECGAAVVDDDNHKAVFMGLGNKSFCAVFKSLKQSPSLDINYTDWIFIDNLLELIKLLNPPI